MTNWKLVIGLEVHIKCNTRTKIYSDSPNNYGSNTNINANWIDLGLPGTLPLLNKEVVRSCVMLGIVLQGQIARKSLVARKSYFYPDLSKGYQLSQEHSPLVENGKLIIDTSKGKKNIRIKQIHIEEDAAKLHHEQTRSSIDHNRAGSPLLEVVTYPDFHSKEEVICFLKKLRNMTKHLGICDGNMQEGSFRADVNISLKKEATDILGTKCEIKNLNSFKYIENAIEYEYLRQYNLLLSGQSIAQETRLFDEITGKTFSMRKKENAIDYRYIIDPDVMPILLTDQDIEDIASLIPMLPEAKQEIYEKHFDKQSVDFLMSHPDISTYLDQIAKKVTFKVAYNWVCIELWSIFQKLSIPFSHNIISVDRLLEVINYVNSEKLSLKSARIVLEAYLTMPYKSIQEIIISLDLEQQNDLDIIRKFSYQIVSQNVKLVSEYRAGKTQVVQFLVGQAIRLSPKALNTNLLRQSIIEELEKWPTYDQ